MDLMHAGTTLHDVVSVISGLMPWAGEPSPSPAPEPTINTNGVVQFIITKIAPILLAALGVVFISRAGKGEMSRVLSSSAIAIVGLAFIAGGAALFAFGQDLVELVITP